MREGDASRVVAPTERTRLIEEGTMRMMVVSRSAREICHCRSRTLRRQTLRGDQYCRKRLVAPWLKDAQSLKHEKEEHRARLGEAQREDVARHSRVQCRSR